MSAIDEIVRANEHYASALGELAQPPPLPPAKHLAIVTCMDARIVPARIFDLREGDAHVIRNAGGSAREALRSLVISERLLGTKEIAVIKHTDCGMLTFKNEDLHAKVQEDLGQDTSDIDFLPFGDLDQGVQDDMAFLKDSPLIPDDIEIRGFVYDVQTRRLNEVTGNR